MGTKVQYLETAFPQIPDTESIHTTSSRSERKETIKRSYKFTDVRERLYAYFACRCFIITHLIHFILLQHPCDFQVPDTDNLNGNTHLM
jgi:hypothetical protein